MTPLGSDHVKRHVAVWGGSAAVAAAGIAIGFWLSSGARDDRRLADQASTTLRQAKLRVEQEARTIEQRVEDARRELAGVPAPPQSAIEVISALDELLLACQRGGLVVGTNVNVNEPHPETGEIDVTLDATGDPAGVAVLLDELRDSIASFELRSLQVSQASANGPGDAGVRVDLRLVWRPTPPMAPELAEVLP